MDIEKVKKILRHTISIGGKFDSSGYLWERDVVMFASQICQLAEEPKPDGGRLISPEKIEKVTDTVETEQARLASIGRGYLAVNIDVRKEVAKAQLAEDQAHEQATVEEIFNILDRESPQFLLKPSKYSNGWNDCRSRFYRLIDKARAKYLTQEGIE